MMRLCDGSPCPYPGMPVSRAPGNGSVLGSNPADDGTGVSRGRSRYGNEPDGGAGVWRGGSKAPPEENPL